MNKRPTSNISATLLFTMALTCATSQAANVFKANNADNLNLGSSWSGGNPPTSADIAVWDFNVTAANTTLLGVDTNWAGVTILDPAGLVTISAGNKLTLGASGINMSLATNNLTLASTVSNAVSQTWSVTNGITLAVSGVVSGPATSLLTKTGEGTLALSGANTYVGGTVVNGGMLQIGTGAVGTGAGTGAVTNNNGTTLRLNTTATLANVFNFNGTVTIDLNNVGGNEGIGSPGAISGSGNVTIINQNTGNRTFTLGGSSSSLANFTGSFSFGTNNGTFRFNDGGGSGNTGSASGTFDLGTGTAIFLTRNRNAPVTLGALFGGATTKIINGTSSSGTSTYSIGGKNIPCQYDGTISDGGSAAAIAITKVGSSTLVLNGTNTYFGATTVSAGTLQVGTNGLSGQLGAGPVVNNATLVYLRSDSNTVANAISGNGSLIQQGTNTITFNGTNTSSGSLIVSNGVAALGATGSLLCPINVSSGAILDVSGNSTFVLSSSLAGKGAVTGLLTAGTGASIRPGGNGTAGTLTFSNGLAQTGSVINNFDLSDDPTGITKTNDRIVVIGDLTLNNVNTIVLNALNGTIPAGTYKLITYTGNLIGSLAGLSTGNPYWTLTNPAGEIDLVVASTRGPASLVWVGNAVVNDWDQGTATNWLNGSLLDVFLSGDNVRFNNTGAANPVVNLVGVLTASSTNSTIVDSTANYTFSGSGDLAGSGGLIKTNSGTLTVLTTNNYSGPTVIGGGVLEVSSLANGSFASGIGAASSNPTNLVFFGTTLRYSGPNTSTDRGATLNGAGATIDVAGGTLALDGTVTGAGALTKSGAGTLALDFPNTYGGGTILSNGVLALGSNLANNDGTGGSGLGATNNPVTFRGGTLQLFGFGGSTTPNYSTLHNPLIVPAGQSGTLRLWPRGPGNSGANSGLRSSLTGSGTLNLVVNYIRDNLDGNWSAFTGLINVTPRPSGSGDELRINNNFGYANASIFLNDGVLMDYQLAANATVDIGELSGSSLASVGTGSLSPANTTWRVGFKNTDHTFAGTIANTVSITKVGTGKWTLTGNNTFTGTTTVSNGVLELSGSGALAASSDIRIISGAFLDVSTLGSPTLALNSGQLLEGTGTLLGSVDNSAGGLVSGGLPLGNLTVTNTVTLGGSGAAWMRVNRAGSPNASKVVAPAILLGGTLVVTNIGPAFQIGDTFDLFDGVLSGSFSTIVLPGYYTWDTSNLGINGTVSVTGILPGPTFSGITSDGVNVTIAATNGAPNGLFTVLASTDLTLPISSWTVVTSGTFDGTGTINPPLAIPVDPAAPQLFYLLNAQ